MQFDRSLLFAGVVGAIAGLPAADKVGEYAVIQMASNPAALLDPPDAAALLAVHSAVSFAVIVFAALIGILIGKLLTY